MRWRMILVTTFVALFAPCSIGAELSAACKPLLAAMEKTLQTDHATVTTRGTQTVHGVTAGGISYLQFGGVWKKSPMTPQENIQQSRENLKNAKSYACKPLPDSMVGDGAVANFATHTDGEAAVIDNTISIDKRTGLAVTVVTDMKEGNMHLVTQYSYGSIKPPM